MSGSWKLVFTTSDEAGGEAALEAFGATVWATEKRSGGIRFEVYFDAQPDLSDLSLPEDATAEIEKLPEMDWVSESQKGLPPVIVPPFHLHGSHDAARPGGYLNIEMQAAMAFGSGHHGTTQGCLYLLVDYLKRHRPRHAADIGCGTGVLAIAAAKAGCRHILASDIYGDAVRIAENNNRLNKVAPFIDCFTARGMHHQNYYGRRFDLILANILAGPLRRLAIDFERHLSAHGQIIVSGLLNEQARAVTASYRAHNLIVEQKIVIGPWTSLRFRR